MRAGDRVTVPFGTRQRLGVVVEADAASEVRAEKLKSIRAVRDDAPRLSGEWLELMRFLSAYYQRPLGETVIGALPPRLRSIKPLPKKALQQASDASGTRFAEHHAPTPDQARAIERVAAAFGSFQPFLLHGITGSGKTEVYLQLIAQDPAARPAGAGAGAGDQPHSPA